MAGSRASTARGGCPVGGVEALKAQTQACDEPLNGRPRQPDLERMGWGGAGGGVGGWCCFCSSRVGTEERGQPLPKSPVCARPRATSPASGSCWVVGAAGGAPGPGLPGAGWALPTPSPLRFRPGGQHPWEGKRKVTMSLGAGHRPWPQGYGLCVGTAAVAGGWHLSEPRWRETSISAKTGSLLPLSRAQAPAST